MLRRAFIAQILSVILVVPVVAEVGAVLPGGAGSGPVDLYILGYIVDDPDPVTILWQPLSPGGTGNVILNQDGDTNGDGPPSLLVGKNPRIPMVAWARNSAQGFDVVLSRFEGGAWTVPEVLAGGAEDELDPYLVLDPSTGDIHLFYWVDGANPRVMHRQSDAALTSWSSSEQVSAPSDAACRPAGVFHDGVLRVAYEIHDYGYNQTPRQVVLAKKVGSTWTPEIMALSNYEGAMNPRVHSHDGRMWVDWIDAPDEAAWTRWSPSTGWDLVQYEPFSTVEEMEFHVRGAIRALVVQ